MTNNTAQKLAPLSSVRTQEIIASMAVRNLRGVLISSGVAETDAYILSIDNFLGIAQRV